MWCLRLCTHYQTRDDKPSRLTSAKRAEILAANDAMTDRALRVLGLAYRLERDVPDDITDIETEKLEKDLVFVGLVGMIDPPREEVKPALEKARRAGIRTVMITGDYPNTARAIAESIGLLKPGRKVATGADLDAMSSDELKREIEQTDVFARVSPEHKLRIVDALQANEEVVAMTGDGVNDAPAIKRADIGVAMGITGTDVAKDTADMVLTDDNYASIVAAVEQGRIIYANIRKFVFFLLSSNVAEIMVIFLATLAGLPSPLTAIQLLWLNLITDGAPALALAMEKGDPDIMFRKPRAKVEPIINRSMRPGHPDPDRHADDAVLTAFGLGLHLASASRGRPARRRQPPRLPAPVRLARRGRADRRDDGLRHAFAVRALPSLHRALRIRLGLPDRHFLEPLHAAWLWGFRLSCCSWSVPCPLSRPSSTLTSCPCASGASSSASRSSPPSPKRSPSSSCASVPPVPPPPRSCVTPDLAILAYLSIARIPPSRGASCPEA